MFYKKFGNSKNVIVFLHGWGADMNSFIWLKNYFADSYSLVFVDFDGFGRSSEPSVALSVFDYATRLKKLLDEFEIDFLVLVGHSFGGRVAIKYSFLFQGYYQKYNIVLVDSAGIKPRRGIVYRIKVNAYKRLKEKSVSNPRLKNKLLNFGSDDYKNLSKVMKQTFVNVVNEDLSECAKHISCKALIVWGKNDTETKLYMAKKFNKLIKNSSLLVLKGAGHFSFLDCPQEFIVALDTFLKNI